MPGGSSLHLVSNKREAMAASVTIALTNKTNEVLEARRQWVKGGEAVNLAVSYGPWGFFIEVDESQNGDYDWQNIGTL